MARVRTRSKRDIPGKGSVILAGGQHRSPIRGRETWLEVTKIRKVPRGFAGIIVRSKESGGWCSDKTWIELQENLTKLDPARTILDVGFSRRLGLSVEQFAGTVLSSQIVAFSEFGLLLIYCPFYNNSTIPTSFITIVLLLRVIH